MSLMQIAPADVFAVIDHTVLNPTATIEDVETACRVAADLGCASVCVRPENVRTAARLLAGSGVGITTVVGFPTGANGTRMKVAEARLAVEHGATEIDMVVDLPNLRAFHISPVALDIAQVRAAAPNALLKVILETAVLDENTIVAGCIAAYDSGADFVKTSTGFHPAGGATPEAVHTMAMTVPGLGIKASGGIRSLDDVTRMLNAGATRIGTSNTSRLFTDDATSGEY